MEQKPVITAELLKKGRTLLLKYRTVFCNEDVPLNHLNNRLEIKKWVEQLNKEEKTSLFGAAIQFLNNSAIIIDLLKEENIARNSTDYSLVSKANEIIRSQTQTLIQALSSEFYN